jgi:hypothetical protein
MIRVILITMILAVSVQSGCTRKTYDPAWATQPYPTELHTTTTADMQVFRKGTDLQIVNSTAHSYSEFDLWINQRYVRHVDSLPAGESVTLSLWDFKDEYGDRFYAGGFFRTREAQVVRLVEIQRGEGQPLLGLIAIRSEEVRVKPEQGR